MKHDTKRILLVSSSGGVLLDLLALEPWWSRYDTVWAVVKAADTEPVLSDQNVRWIRDLSLRRPLGAVLSLAQAWRITRAERPDLIVSAGSGPAIPFFIIARALSLPSFWVSTLNVLATPGISARVCASIASHVLIQQPSLRDAHPHGFVIGELY
jgi:UDP-N-acetylglucosamine:LPS N-acetylglucosamine transferase